MTDTIPSSGVVHDGHHTRTDRIYFEHTDFSGVVYHARYLDFLEHARSDYVRMLGVHHSKMAEGCYGEPLAFAVHRMEIDFKAPARIDDVIVTTTQRGTLKGMRLTFGQSIACEGRTLLEAKVSVVLMSPDGRPRRYPAELLESLGVAPAARPA